MIDTVVPELRDFDLELAILGWSEEVWHPAVAHQAWQPAVYAPEATGTRVTAEHDESLSGLRRRWAPDELGRLAADMYFAPLAWQPRYSRYDSRPPVVLSILRAAIESWPPADIVERIEQRLNWLFQHPFGTGWVREQLPPCRRVASWDAAICWSCAVGWHD